MTIPDRLIADGGWITHEDESTFNLYRAPEIELGDATKAQRWLDHIHRVFNKADAAHCIKFLAQRVQRPGEKINHALVLGGKPGIGKDSILAPARQAVGVWNFLDVSPIQLLGRFNAFAKCTILRVDEARDLGEADRFKLYHHTKVFAASPPEVLRVDEKNMREYYVPNVLGLIITTNHKTDGIYLPADDRRYYVAWSDRKKEYFTDEYWKELWRWYEEDGGFGHVAAYLAELDISGFNPKAPPPKTPAFWDIVNVGEAPEDAELADVIDKLGNPEVLVVPELMANAAGTTAEWLMDRKSWRSLPHRLERCGYVVVRNPDADDGRWKVPKGKRLAVYGRNDLPAHKREAAARGKIEELGRSS
jgi:hypothetical protein